MQEQKKYIPKNKIRVVTAASLFDGHDAAINVMRRVIQDSGVEVIHLGHDKSVLEVVSCAIQEDVQAIAMTSYQGGHIEYFKYMYDLLREQGINHIKIFGGGGGTILPSEIKELENYGICKIYHPDDGRRMGLQGMIDDMLSKCDFPVGKGKIELSQILKQDKRAIAQAISIAEHSNNKDQQLKELVALLDKSETPVLGITGTGGAGKSSLIDELVRRYLLEFEDKTLAIVSVDPSKRKTKGALLGDRIRMNAVNNHRVYMRSLATREINLSLSKSVKEAVEILKVANYDLIILESSGIGQSGTEVLDYSDLALYVMTPEYGAASQLEKIDMLDFADAIAINKFDHRGAQDALKDVKKQYKRNHKLFEQSEDTFPVFGTIASRFNDSGVNSLFYNLMHLLTQRTKMDYSITKPLSVKHSAPDFIIPPKRIRYLAEIAENNRNYDKRSENQSKIADELYALEISKKLLSEKNKSSKEVEELHSSLKDKLTSENKAIIKDWQEKKEKYKSPYLEFKVRNKTLKVSTHTKSLSRTRISKVSLPEYRSWGDILKWNLQENVPGSFPYTAGLFPFKREGEDPTRMFAGEGGPERTNRRFHYVSKNMPFKRLSTAFDSVTLYGQDPNVRPDIYGKIGNSGVSICCLDDAKKLYSGFDLSAPGTSVSMTINGPAPIMLGYFLNAAIDQQCEKYIKENGLISRVELLKKKKYIHSEKFPKYQGKIPEGNNQLGLLLLGITGEEILEKSVYEKIKADTLSKVRGTVQADILKEDQAQNTCIFSTEFAIKLMGDVQEYFIQKHIRNFYSVSISGYHIAEAGANPITQLAFTLANGFTYVEYYLSRGMDINKFALNLSFFFSNGIDPEYAVIGRVARRIWAKAMKYKYGANDRSQMLKYHIQTSGRSLHAQEIDFNDIRTTLQALYAIYDNCNSLHTNAYDEAITTPTESSVRRAIAIQLIINKELGLAKNENPLQGSFIIEELTDLVEEAVLKEFENITERGGVLGAMETMYQRSKIQEESLHYENLKHSGAYPIIGVNTFLGKEGSKTIIPEEVVRSDEEEKEYQISMLKNLHKANKKLAASWLSQLKKEAGKNQNMFVILMEAVKYCSIGQITEVLFKSGGQYRRSM